MQKSFTRIETKFLLTVAQAAAMEEGLRRRGFSRMDFGSPRVQSLYFDTRDYALIRASLERPVFKEKLRLRAYGEPGTLETSYLEIKRKFRKTGYKRRASLPLEQAMESLSAGLLPPETGQVGREAQWMLGRYDLRPAALIGCERDAWTCPEEPEVRITFDRNITFRDRNMDMNRKAAGYLLLAAGQRLMEIKTEGAFPLWLSLLLAENGARRTHFSKYGTAYREYIRPEKEGIEGGGANCSEVSLPVGA